MIKQQKEFVARAIFRFGSKSMTSECRPYPNTRRFRPTLSEQAAYLDAAEPVDEACDVDSSDSELREEWEWDGQLIVDINQNRSKGLHQIKYLNNSLLTGLKTMGIKNLSPLQMAIVNSTVRHGPFQTDLYVSSPKGTGKRLGYAIPIVESVTKEDGLQALIVVCDRTSALKVRSIFLQLTCYMEISVGIAAPFLPSSEESDCIVDDRESTSDMITEKCQVLICTPEALMKSEVGLGELKYLVIDDMEHLLREDQLEENEFTSRLPTKLEVAKICTTEQNVTDLTNLNGLGLKNPKVLLTGPFAGVLKQGPQYGGAPFFGILVLLATGGGHLVYLEIGDGVLTEVKHIQLEYDISCLDIYPIGDNPNHSQLAAVGMWTDISVRIFSLPDLNLIIKEHLEGEIIPRSVLLCSFEGISYLLCALGGGHLLNFMNSGDLSTTKRKLLMLKISWTVI